MKDYQVQITETLQRVITIKAKDAIEAKRITETLYKEEKIVLDFNDHIETQILSLIDFCTTKQLIERLKVISPKILECNLQISGLNATHHIFIKGNKIYDEGIDGKITQWNIESFMENYVSNQWIIDYIE